MKPDKAKLKQDGATLVDVPNGAISYMLGGKMLAYMRNPEFHTPYEFTGEWNWIHSTYRK